MGESVTKPSGWYSLIWLAIIAVAGFIIFQILTPNFVSSGSGPSSACINNLRQIDAAMQQWALENGITNGDTIVTEKDIQPFLGRELKGNIPRCPSGGKYTIGKLNQPPTCSIGTNANPPHVLP
jgi:hypothetical protein